MPAVILEAQLGMLDVVVVVVDDRLVEVMLVIESVEVETLEELATAPEVKSTLIALVSVLLLVVEPELTTTHKSTILPKPKSTPKSELLGPSLPTIPGEHVGKEAEDDVAEDVEDIVELGELVRVPP